MKGQHAQASGQSFENLVEHANLAYKLDGEALVNKREVAVRILSNRNGRITGTLKKRSTTDYEGILKGGRSIQFEAKTTTLETRFEFNKIEEHQVEFLRDAGRMGAMSFLLVEFSELRSVFVVPTYYLVRMWGEWKFKRGRASLPIEEIRHYGAYVRQAPDSPLDYIAAARELRL